MTEQSPYSSPEAQQHPPFAPQQFRSNVPKVFGIIHIIYAVLGIGMSLVGVVSFLFADKMMGAGLYGEQQIAEYMSVVNKIAPYTYLDTAVRIALGIMLFISGIKLIKYQYSGLKLSNFWSISRVLWLIIFTALTYSITKEIQQAAVKLNPETAAIQSSIGTVTMLFTIVPFCIYPILSYILLNRASVKKDLN